MSDVLKLMDVGTVGEGGIFRQCEVLLKMLPQSLISTSASIDEKGKCLHDLLKEVIKQNSHQYVKGAGEYLGWITCSEEEVRKRINICTDLPNKSWPQPLRKGVREAVAGRHVNVNTVKSMRDTYAKIYAEALVQALRDFLRNEQAVLEFGREFGFPSHSVDSDETLASVQLNVDSKNVAQSERNSPSEASDKVQQEQRSRYPWRLSVAMASALILGAATIVALNQFSGQPVKQTKEPSEPLSVKTSWSTLRGCDGATEVAMQPGHASAKSFAGDRDIRRSIANAPGGGSWGIGHLYLDLAGNDDAPVQISDLHPRIIRKNLPAPAWIFGVNGGCGDSYSRVFQLNLDKPSMRDLGVKGSPQLANGTNTPRPDPLGPSFNVTRRDVAQVVVDAVSCHGNYEWELDIEYVHDGHKRTKTVGPFRSMGVAKKTVPYNLSPYDGKTIRKGKAFAGSSDDLPCSSA